jgi:hypothetical protein
MSSVRDQSLPKLHLATPVKLKGQVEVAEQKGGEREREREREREKVKEREKEKRKRN